MLNLEDYWCKNSSLFVRIFVGITCGKLTSILKTLNKKFLGKEVGEVVRPNLYKSLVQFSYSFSFLFLLFVSAMLKYVFYYDFIFFTYSAAYSLFKLQKRILTIIFIKYSLIEYCLSKPHNSPL